MTFQELIDHLNASGADGREYLKRYTPEFVREGLLSVAKPLGLYIAFTEDTQLPTYVAGRQIAIYMDLLWRRLRDWETADLDFLVWTMRNLLELHFWTKFITESPENATAFNKEAEIDQRELFEVFFKHQGDFTDIATCVAQVLVNDAPSGRHRKVPIDDKILWTECCKYAHPTPWLLNDYNHHMKNEYMRQKVIAFGLSYAALITRMLLLSNPDTEVLLLEDDSLN